MTEDAPGLHPISGTDSVDRRADIVFVHGLAGAAHSTWRHGKQGDVDHFFWPQELGKELPDCGVWTFGYDAGITNLGRPGMAITLRAGNLARQIINRGIGKRPLIFITHSMGGLVVKALVCDHPHPENAELIQSIRGIIFCGTPHRGSDFAEAAGVLGRYFGIFRIQKHVEEMRRNKDALDTLNDRFRSWHQGSPIGIQTYVETNGIFRRKFLWGFIPFGILHLGLVVSRASANTGVGPAPVDVDADHLDLVKPSRGNRPLFDTVFLGTLHFIQEALNPPPLQPYSELSDRALLATYDAIRAEIALRDLGLRESEPTIETPHP